MGKCILLLLLCTQLGGGPQHKVFNYQGSRFAYKLFVTRNIFSDKYEYICGIDSIMISDKSIPGLGQTLICEGNGYNCNDTDKPFFRIEDMNFDGIEDISILQYHPSGADIPYYYWLYNVKTRKYEQNKDLETVTAPVFDPKRKCIVSEWRKSARNYGTATYEFIDGRPVKTDETEKLYDADDYVTTTVRKRMKGRLVVVSKIREKVAD